MEFHNQPLKTILLTVITFLSYFIHMPHPRKFILGWEEGKLENCWLAGTLSTKIFNKKFRKSTIDNINVCELSDCIKDMVERNNDEANADGKCNLYMSSLLAYGLVKIFSYKISNLEKDIFNMMEELSSETNVKKRKEERDYRKKVIDPLDVRSTHSAQLHEDLHLLPNEYDIDINLANKMNDAACLDFGALTEKELSFINRPDADISLLEFERAFPSIEDFRMDMYEDQNKMVISPVHDDITAIDEEHQISFTKMTPQKITIGSMESRKSNLLTPQKRDALEKKDLETPSKRRRLRFEDESDVDEVATTRIPETAIVSIPATDYPSELSQNLDVAQNNLLEVERKPIRKRVFADKNIKLSNKTIRKWLANTNAHLMASNIINTNIPTAKVIFKAPSTYFTSIPERKWNNSLSLLFHMHTVTIPEKITMPIEYEELMEKSTEFTRFGEGNNKTEDPSELFSTLGKTLQLSPHTTSAVDELEDSSIFQKKYYKKETIYDSQQEILHHKILQPNITGEIDLESVEESLKRLNVEQSVFPDLKTCEDEKEGHQETFELFASCSLTKSELLALLEVHWRNTEMVRYTDVIEPDNYSKNDAACCFIFLLELHKEKKITLEQARPYDILWIKKYS